jgi:hypothetical protein
MVVDNNRKDRINPRNVKLHQKNGEIERIKDEYSGYLALWYPIFFPYGQPGWARGIPSTKKEVSAHCFQKLKHLLTCCDRTKH